MSYGAWKKAEHLIEKMEQLIVDDINKFTGKQFIILMDEWDAIFHLYKTPHQKIWYGVCLK